MSTALYLGYPHLLATVISDALRRKLGDPVNALPIQHAMRGESWPTGSAAPICPGCILYDNSGNVPKLMDWSDKP